MLFPNKATTMGIRNGTQLEFLQCANYAAPKTNVTDTGTKFGGDLSSSPTLNDIILLE